MKSSNSESTPDKPLSESQTRQKYFALAKRLGCQQDLAQIFQRYDRLLKNCTDPVERQQIAVMANVEVHKFFSFVDPLIVGRKEILPAHPDWKGYEGQRKVERHGQ